MQLKYGIIPPKKQKKVLIHTCKKPLTWFRDEGTLFRCECGKVYYLKYSFTAQISYWSEISIDAWLDAGGSK